MQLTLPNTKASLETARCAMLDFVAGQGLSQRAVFRLELVLEETLMNRIWHAFPDGGVHAVELDVRLTPDEVVMSFEDDGVEFDPLQAPAPPRPATLAQASPGGLGLILTRKAARECRYEREAGRNRFTVHLARV